PAPPPCGWRSCGSGSGSWPGRPARPSPRRGPPPSPSGPDHPPRHGMGADRTLLVTVTGRDRPGVTSALFGALAGADIEVVDVEQVVIRGRLVLGVLIAVGDDEAAVRAELAEVAEHLGMDVEVASGAGEEAPRIGGR